jgi:hypothetical protein
MPATSRRGTDRFRSERRKILASGILDALIEFAEGRREMSSCQVSASLGLLKKAIPDLASEALSDDFDRDEDGNPTLEKDLIEIRIVDPHR